MLNVSIIFFVKGKDKKLSEENSRVKYSFSRNIRKKNCLTKDLQGSLLSNESPRKNI